MKNNFENIIERLDKIEKRIDTIEKFLKVESPRVTTTSPSRKTSIREFLIEKKPNDDVKKTLAIGYYFERFDSMISFSAKDIEDAFERAKEKKPSNINDKINMNIKNGHLEETSEKKDGRKAWYLTNSGQAFVENSFTSKPGK